MKSSRWFISSMRAYRFGIVPALAGLLFGSIEAPAHAYDCPPSPSPKTGPNYSGQTLNLPNFSQQDLTNANFANAHLIGANFVGANLTGANFSGANFSGATIDTQDPAIPSDFSFANLTSACFIGATIGNPTYFTYATLTCAEFSQTNLNNNANAIFGDSLTIATDPGNDPNKLSCRTTFRAATMNCEFIDDWRWLDLSGATIDDACRKQLGGKDFSGAKMANVDFSLSDPQASVDLTKTKWNNADLTGAVFTGAILDGADFTSATLTAANLTYIQAKGTIFSGAQLKADQINGKPGATADFAHLEDVKFDGADLSYASFGYVTLTGPKVVLSKATLTGSKWENANLSGIDLTGLTALGADFGGANLANTSLKNTNLAYNEFKATGTTTLTQAELEQAYFCGATLDATVLTCADLTGAYSVSASQPVTGPDGKQTTCDATIITTDPNGQYTTKTEGVANKCNTLCPNGSNGPCITQAQWQFRNTGPKVCCVRKSGDPPCPPVKKAGKPCTSDCDCHSKKCSNGFCADDAALMKALLLKRAGRRP